MKETKPYQNRIHIYHQIDGKLWTFDNIQEACRYTDAIRALGEIGPHFKIYSHSYRYVDTKQKVVIYDCNTVIIRDDFGNDVHINELVTEWNKRFKPKSRYFRNGPRRLSGSKHSGYRWYRALRTTNERRQAVDNRDAYDDWGVVIKPRGSRNFHNLPNSWDDYCQLQNHSWKKHRNTQWV